MRGRVAAARMARLVYGAADPRAGAAGSLWDVLRDRRLAAPAEVIGGVLGGRVRRACCATSSPRRPARRDS